MTESVSSPRLVRRDDRSSVVGHTIWHADTLPSTNEYLRRMFVDGQARHGSVVSAGEQTAGRGRRGRRWHALPGSGLLCSVVLAPVDPRVTYCVAAIAVRNAIAATVPVHPTLKWPNDLLIDGRKLGGILIEQVLDGAIVGTGINTNMSKDELARIGPEAISLAAHCATPVDNATLLENLLEQLEVQYIRSRRSSNDIFQDWRSALVTLGQTVEVETVRDTWVGQAVDVGEDGSLLVRNDKQQIVRVYAADVRIRTEQGK